jgi:formate dehydrogenase iron-sulfur subunit
MAHLMMLIDTSRCIGCKSCQIACQQWHKKSADATQFTGSYTNPPDKSANNFNVVKFFEYENGNGLKFLFFPDRCRHCVTPWCKVACPVNAIVQFPWGGVVVNEQRCGKAQALGLCTRQCEAACPYKSGFPPKGTPRFAGLNLPAQKCDFCYDKFNNATLRGDSDPGDPQLGGRFKGAFAKGSGDPAFSNRPACEVACPTGALRTNWHTKLIPFAQNRVAYLQANGFPHACLYPAPDPSVNSHMLWVLTEGPYAYGLEWGA